MGEISGTTPRQDTRVDTGDRGLSDTERWWVIHESILHSALMRAQHGEDADMLLLELTANADTETVDGN